MNETDRKGRKLQEKERNSKKRSRKKNTREWGIHRKGEKKQDG